jgi:hypothetical protein|tara:strand:+ start:448 stop:1071 length:624 start_codon:yes stop_codon:yes gene_type:complete
MNTIIQKLSDVQARLKAPKGQFNSFGKYKYRSCEDIVEAVKPLLTEHGLALVMSDSIVETGGRVYVHANAIVSDGEREVSASGFAREEENKKGMDGSQVTGAASSYARKYALNGLFCIDDGKDSDSTNTHGRATASTQKKQATSQSKTSKPKADEKVMDQAVAFIQNSKNPQQAYAMSVEKYDFTPKQDNELLETVNQSVVASGKKK